MPFKTPKDASQCIKLIQNAKLKKSPKFRVSVDNVEITAKKSVTYLGCILDNTLSGENMALKVLSKINQRTKVLA